MHDRETCEWCQAEAVMKKVMELVESLPEYNVPLFDDAVTAVYNAADNAQSILRCWAVALEAKDDDHEK